MHCTEAIERIAAMLFLLTSRTRQCLSAEQFAALAALAKSFYSAMPADLILRGEWAAVDRSANYALLEAPDIETVRHAQAPFAPYTETTIVPVQAITGWTASPSN